MGKNQGLQHIFTAKEPPQYCAFVLDQDADGKQFDVVLSHAIRWISGKRLVAKARWQGKQVYAKLFFGGQRSRSAWQHEVKSLRFMAEHGIAAPKVLWTGTVEQHRVFVLLMEPVTPAVALGTLWLACQSVADQTLLLHKIMALLAEHHRVGMAQCDLHWDNFLCKENNIYSLDAGDLIIKDRELSRAEREENLAQFFSLLLPQEDGLVVDGVAYYNNLLSVTSPVSLAVVQSLASKKRLRKHRKYTGKKIFRSCTEFYCKRTWAQVILCNRAYYADIEKFLFEPNLSLTLPKTTMLKEGNACTVWSVQTGVRKYVVKRYNIKSVSHGLGRLFRPTNAAQSWRAAHLLRCYGIQTPRPVALIEERFGLCRGRAYFITEYMDGLHFWDYFFDPAISMEEKERRALQTKDLFDLLLKTGICHGDMKGQNLMVTEAGVGLIDLDDVRQFSWSFIAQYWHNRDIRRFMRNWQKDPELLQLFSTIFSDKR